MKQGMFFFFSSRRRHTRCSRDWSSDVCSSDLIPGNRGRAAACDVWHGRWSERGAHGMIGDDSPKQRPIPHLRWWIAALLFASTVINYIDRQTLSLLAPYLKQDYHWTNTDYANLVIAFRVAYSIGQTLDRKSTRLNSSHGYISYAVFCLKKKKHTT